jgi:hypothetical protein
VGENWILAPIEAGGPAVIVVDEDEDIMSEAEAGLLARKACN